VSLFRRRRAERVDDAELSDSRSERSSSSADRDDADRAEETVDARKKGTRELDAEDLDASLDEDAEEIERVGPYDVDEAPDDDLERLDLGSLKIPALPGVEVQIQANEQGEVAAVALIAGANAVQLGVFAAPRTEGIWDEVRGELHAGLKSEGGTATEIDGDYGVELRGRIKTPNGPQDVRFVGVDGPRWFVRAVFHGKVATDPSAAPELVDCLRSVIVDRGREAMPVREPLPLRLPAEALQQQEEAAAQEAAEPGDDIDGHQAPGRR
jgi:hypothetical protein